MPTWQQTNKKKQATDFSFLIAVYLLILSMVVFNSGTLSLRDCGSQTPRNPPSLPPLQTPVPKRKKIYFCFSVKEILIFVHLLLFFSLIYFHCISMYLFFVIILWVFISFFALLLYYYFYGCIKCIYVSWPWVTPLLSWALSHLV